MPPKGCNKCGKVGPVEKVNTPFGVTVPDPRGEDGDTREVVWAWLCATCRDDYNQVEEMNPNLPEIDLTIGGPSKMRTLMTIMSSEPNHWSCTIPLDADPIKAHLMLRSVRQRATIFLSQLGEDPYGVMNHLEAFAQEHAGWKVRLQITMEVVGED